MNETMNGDGLWLFALLILFGMGGGFGFGGNAKNTATQDDLNFGRLESQVQGIAASVNQKSDALGNGIATLGYEMANKFGETNMLIVTENQKTRDMIQQDKIATLTAQVNELKTAQAISNATNCIPKINPYLYGITCNNNCNY